MDNIDDRQACPTTTKVCASCGHRLPIGAFRRVYTGQDLPRRSQCRDCRNRREREARRRDRLPRLRDRLRQVKAAGCVRRIDAVIQTLLREQGGVDRFSESVAELMDTGRDADRQLAVAAVLSLIEAQHDAQQAEKEAQRDAEPDWNDPTLQRQAALVGVQFLLRHPEQLTPHAAGLIARKPSILREAIERPTVKALLMRWGYRRDDRPDATEARTEPQFADVL